MAPWQDTKGSRETGCGLGRRMRSGGSKKKRGGDAKEGGGEMTVSPRAEQLQTEMGNPGLTTSLHLVAIFINAFSCGFSSLLFVEKAQALFPHFPSSGHTSGHSSLDPGDDASWTFCSHSSWKIKPSASTLQQECNTSHVDHLKFPKSHLSKLQRNRWN